MGLGLAIKAFFKALRNPDEAKSFLSDQSKIATKKEVDSSHLQLLSLLQGSGRLVDFLQEDLSGCSDAQVGAAARKVQEDCRKILEDVVTIRPLFEESEGADIRVSAGYDVSELKLVGNVSGNPPYQGRLIHRGWKAHKRSLPRRVGEQQVEVLCQAEVEIR